MGNKHSELCPPTGWAEKWLEKIKPQLNPDFFILPISREIDVDDIKNCVNVQTKLRELYEKKMAYICMKTTYGKKVLYTVTLPFDTVLAEKYNYNPEMPNELHVYFHSEFNPKRPIQKTVVNVYVVYRYMSGIVNHIQDLLEKDLQIAQIEKEKIQREVYQKYFIDPPHEFGPDITVQK